MSEISPYGTSQHAGREGPVTANQLVGERVGLATGEGVSPSAGPAMHSTAPYRGPGALPRRTPDTGRVGPKGCRGKNGTCQAPAMGGRDHCIFHDATYQANRKAIRESSTAP